MRVFWLGILLFWGMNFGFHCCFSQPDYNHCGSALELCPNTVVKAHNLGATKTLCGGCEDDFTFCFTPQNTIWLTFTTHNLGGDVQINFSNVVFELDVLRGSTYHAALLLPSIACNSVGYSLLGNCLVDELGDQTISALGLAPQTTYYLVLSGSISGSGVTLPAEFSMDIAISGSAVDRPIPTISANLLSAGCATDAVSVVGWRTNCQDGGAFRWSVNGALTSVSASDSIFSTTNLKNGDTLYVETDCFLYCPTTISDTLFLSGLVNVWADAGSDTTMFPGSMIQLNGTASPNTSILWSPSFSLSNPAILTPIAYPTQTTTYTLYVTDTLSGCSTADYITLTVKDELLIPNTFSPNQDGDNDSWEIRGIEQFPDCLVSIYNRWGQLVFQTTGYDRQKAWDGTSSVGKANESVYFYEIELRDSQKQLLKGSITLIR